jgi:hypothetical protein
MPLATNSFGWIFTEIGANPGSCVQPDAHRRCSVAGRVHPARWSPLQWTVFALLDGSIGM